MSRKVLITAGGAGIGFEIAKAFAALGDKIYICDVDTQALAAASRTIPDALVQPCDMSRRAEIERMVPDAASSLGGIDVLVNNAGIAGPTRPTEEMPPAEWDRTLAIELGEWAIRANAIAPGAVAGDRIERVFAGRASISGLSVAQERDKAMSEQSIKQMVDPKDIAQLAVFLASDAARAISGQVIPIDNDRQRA
jgi:NAD(P)-dependent dehydrogenase (short-subunit alcohol dehydrogenase family)